MARIVNITDHFQAAHIGQALGRLYHVDGLLLCLHPALDEMGERLSCPITLDPITPNAALIEDDGVYQMGAIAEWFRNAGTSPLTGLHVHRNVLHMQSLTDVVHAILETCRAGRAQARAHHFQAWEATCGNYDSAQAVQDARRVLGTYIAERKAELAAWEGHLGNLQLVMDSLNHLGTPL